MVVVHGQVHAAAGDAGLVREDGQRGLVLAVVPPVRARRCLYMWKSNFGRPTPSTRRCLCVCSISIHELAVRLGERRVVDVRAQLSIFLGVARGDRREGSEPPHRFGVPKVASSRPAFFLLQRSPLVVKRVGPIS